MSEKMDGFRAKWNGEKFMSSNGNVFDIPAWFSEGLPKSELVGELWIGRGMFEELQRVYMTGRGWARVRFAVFDMPRLPFPFPITWGEPTPHSFIIPQIVCQGIDHLESFYAETLDSGGEGMMLRGASFLQKFKPEHDEEGVVTGYIPSKVDGGIGALVLQNHRGTFRVCGMKDAVRFNPPAVGKLVTYFYGGLTAKGLPKFPKLKAERLVA